MPHPKIYLDNNGSTPLDPAVRQAILDYLDGQQANPSSVHHFGQTARGILNQARSTIATHLGVRPEEICFTSGATEGVQALIRGVLETHPQAHIISSGLEHACVYQPLKKAETQGWNVTWLSSSTGAIDLDALTNAIQPETKLIVLSAVNNETGVKNPIKEIADLAQTYRIPFIVDSVALLGKEPFSIPPGVSALCFSGHKIHAPAGIGFNILRPPFKAPALFLGGPQEYGRRAGSENLIGIVGLAKAIELLSPTSMDHMALLRDHLETQILAELSDVTINGSGPRVCNTTNLAFGGVDGESLLMNLDQAGIAVSHGSACSSGALEPSRILLNMGIPLKLARASLRYSVSRMNTLVEIDTAIATTLRIVKALRHTSNP